MRFAHALPRACGGSQSAAAPQGGTSDLERCATLAKPTVDQALAEVDRHAACTADDDCVTLDVAAACFDLCSRTVNKAGVDAVKATLGSTDCTQLWAAGCVATPPPCAPPAPPKCNAGRCE